MKIHLSRNSFFNFSLVVTIFLVYLIWLRGTLLFLHLPCTTRASIIGCLVGHIECHAENGYLLDSADGVDSIFTGENVKILAAVALMFWCKFLISYGWTSSFEIFNGQNPSLNLWLSRSCSTAGFLPANLCVSICIKYDFEVNFPGFILPSWLEVGHFECNRR